MPSQDSTMKICQIQTVSRRFEPPIHDAIACSAVDSGP